MPEVQEDRTPLATGIPSRHAFVPKRVLLDVNRVSISDAVGVLDSPYGLQLLKVAIDDRWPTVLRPYIQHTTPIWLASRQEAIPPPLSQLADDLRGWIDLPVQDIARMCGLQRRQFYNLLAGTSGRSLQESRIRVLHAVVRELATLVGESTARLRSVLLTPIAEDFRSFFDIAAAGDLEQIRAGGTELRRRLEEGDVRGMVPRPSPALWRLQAAEPGSQTVETLREFADRSEADGG